MDSHNTMDSTTRAVGDSFSGVVHEPAGCVDRIVEATDDNVPQTKGDVVSCCVSGDEAARGGHHQSRSQ